MAKRKPPPAAPAMTGTRLYEVLAAAIKSIVQRFVSGYSLSCPALVGGLGVAVVALGLGLGLWCWNFLIH